MAFQLLYLVTVRMFDALLRAVRSDKAVLAELLGLRHEVPVQRRWTYPHRGGRSSVSDEIRELICRMARDNPAGATRQSTANSSDSGHRVGLGTIRQILAQGRLGLVPRYTS